MNISVSALQLSSVISDSGPGNCGFVPSYSLYCCCTSSPGTAHNAPAHTHMQKPHPHYHYFMPLIPSDVEQLLGITCTCLQKWVYLCHSDLTEVAMYVSLPNQMVVPGKEGGVPQVPAQPNHGTAAEHGRVPSCPNGQSPQPAQPTSCSR